jgi:hypothetical protein
MPTQYPIFRSDTAEQFYLAALSLLKISTGLRRLVIFASRSYRRGYGDDSLGRFIDLDFPLSQPRRARA